jgi:hypothetical protein
MKTAFYERRIFFTCIIVFVSFILSFYILPFLGSAFFIFLLILYFITVFRKIPAEPPTMGIVTFFGRKVPITLGEGFVFLPFRPFVYDIIPVDMRERITEIEPANLRTPNDPSEVSVRVSIMWSPDSRNLIVFENEGEDNIRQALADAVDTAVRQIMANPAGDLSFRVKADQLSEELATSIVKSVFSLENNPDSIEIARQSSAGSDRYRVLNLGIIINRIFTRSSAKSSG